MKVVWVSDTFEQFNGVTTYIKSIVPLLQKHMDIEVLTGRVTREYSFPVKSLPNIPAPFQRDYDIILPTFRKVDADIMHVHTAYSLGLYSSFLNAKKVTTTHLHPYHLLEGVFGHKQPRVFQNLAWWYVLSFFNRFDVVVCQTNATKEMYRERGLKARAEVVPNGMNSSESIENLKPRINFKEKYGIKGEFAFYLGRIDASKRINWVIEAAEKIPDREFVIVGKGTLEKRIHEKDNIHFYKFLDHEDKLAAFNECSMLLMPSLIETEGLVAQEAMLFKKPVLISDNPVLMEVVGSGGIACNTVEKLIEQTRYLFENNGIREEIGEKSLEEVKKRDINKSVEKLVKIYESLM
ncbi:MAG: glycosyltransferase family 4 protein [Candidatus Altiarchaeota archaeon]|nr:glycosyltransferase family 4 protein [Candidatus Altiarchaeota archaeon]